MTITLTREEAQQVLDAIVLSMPMFAGHNKQHAAAIETLRARLAQSEPAPVAWCRVENGRTHGLVRSKPAVMNAEKWQPLYTAPPQPEPKDDGHCQACDGDHCTAKTGCVALSNPPDAKWEPLVERLYSPDGTLLSEKIKYTPEGEWQDFKQPKPKPVAWTVGGLITDFSRDFSAYKTKTYTRPLYTAPPQREWQGLTDEEYEAMAEKYVTNCYFDTLKYALAIEAKLKEKNA